MQYYKIMIWNNLICTRAHIYLYCRQCEEFKKNNNVVTPLADVLEKKYRSQVIGKSVTLSTDITWLIWNKLLDHLYKPHWTMWNGISIHILQRDGQLFPNPIMCKSTQYNSIPNSMIDFLSAANLLNGHFILRIM